MRIAADASTNSITSTRRIYQNISGGINDLSWASVNGYYALAKDAYPGLNSYSSLAKTSTWRGVTITNPSILTTYWSSTAWSPSLGLFVCVGNKGTGTTTVMTSRDGINWNPITIANSNITDSYWNAICWSPELNIFVAGSAHGASPVRFMTSNNGVNWTPASYYIGVPVFAIVWSSQLGIFVALMYTSWLRILTSTDGSNWTERPLPTSPQNLMNSNLEALCWSPELGLFVAVATDGVRAISSKNGIIWSSCNVPASCVDVQWVGITWSGQLGIFVSVARAGGPAGSPRIMTSYDGINWTARGLNNEKWLDVCWSAELELFVIVTDNDSISSRIKTSRDGINWTLASSGPPLISNYLNRVIWCPELGIFLANGSGNFIITISSLKARPPTSSNVFDSSFNSIDENGNWTLKQLTLSDLSPTTTVGDALNNLLLRMGNIEATAVTRSLDVVVSSAFNHNIDIDLLTYESVEIDFLFKFTGTNNVPLKMLPNNGISTAQLWEEYNGRIIAGNNGVPTTLNRTSHNGVVLHQLETLGFTASISCKIFKVYDVGVHIGRYSFLSTGVYCLAGTGHSRIDVTAMHNQFRPTGLNISLPSSATLMSFSYSIINKKQVTSANIATITNIVSSTSETNAILNSLLARTTFLEQKTQRLVFWSDQTITFTSNSLVVISNYLSIVVNYLTSINNNNSVNATLTLPFTGTYIITICGNRCGQGSGQVRAQGYRGTTLIFDRLRYAAYQDCSLYETSFIWNGFQAGDTLKLFKNQNNSNATSSSTPNLIVHNSTSLINTNDDGYGPVKIWYLGSS